ncbi:MAG: hypothetical protein WB627_09345 [Candidatus Acidiferrum sp.]
MISGQEFFLACITEHGYQGSIRVDRYAIRVTPIYSVYGIVHQRAIQRLRVPQGFSGLIQLLTELPFVESLTNSRRQLCDAVSLHVIKNTVSSQLRDGLTSHRAGHKQQWNIPHLLMEDLQRLGTLYTRARVLGNYHIVGLGVQLFGTLCEVQDEICVQYELRLFQLFQAVLYYLRITVDEEHSKGPAPVKSRTAHSENRQIRP